MREPLASTPRMEHAQVRSRPLGRWQVDSLVAMHNAQTPTPVRSAGRHRDLMLKFGDAHGRPF